MQQSVKVLKNEINLLDQKLNLEKTRVCQLWAAIAPKPKDVFWSVTGLSILAAFILMNKKSWTQMRNYLIKRLTPLMTQQQFLVPLIDLALLRYFTKGDTR